MLLRFRSSSTTWSSYESGLLIHVVHSFVAFNSFISDNVVSRKETHAMNAVLERAANDQLPSADEVRQARESMDVLAAFVRDQHLEFTVFSEAHGARQLILPNQAIKLLIKMLGYMGQGKSITMVPQGYEMTSQQAADLLNVSRPYLIGLVENGEINCHKVGTHRRLRFEDVLAYRGRQRTDSEQTMDELTALSQELGDY